MVAKHIGPINQNIFISDVQEIVSYYSSCHIISQGAQHIRGKIQTKPGTRESTGPANGPTDRLWFTEDNFIVES